MSKVKRILSILFGSDVCEYIYMNGKYKHIYKTGCNRSAYSELRAMIEDEYAYCPYCGRRIKVVDK